MTNEFKTFLDEINGKNINFLIGSGASSEIIPTLKIDSWDKSFEDVLASSMYSDDQKMVLYYAWFNIWVKQTLILNENNQEDEQKNNLNTTVTNYKNFISNIITILEREGFDKPKRINIFTTNYDTLFELAFDTQALNNRLTFFNDGSRGFLTKYVSSENFYMITSHSGISDNFQRNIPTINLIKLHGSITWKKTKITDTQNEVIEASVENEIYDKLNQICTDIDLLINQPNTNPFDSNLNTFLSTNIQESIFSKFSESDFKNEIDSFLNKFKAKLEEFMILYRKLAIVNPTKKKFYETVFEQHYYQLLRMLSFELEKKDTVLIVFGFSFADEHILEIVKRAMLNPYLKLYVITYTIDDQKKLKKLFSDFSAGQIEFMPNLENQIDGSNIYGNFTFLNNILGGKADGK